MPVSLGAGPYLKRDANNNVIQSSSEDMAFRGEYDVNNNLIYKGLARPGAVEGSTVWQIAKLTYDASNNLTSILWPSGSSEYQFSWTNRAALTYS